METDDGGEHITYLPGEGDPHTIKWRGVEFRANTPVWSDNSDMIEAARTNRFFRVGDASHERRHDEAPQDAMEYRRHVLNWMKSVTTVDQLVTNWSADRSLRDKCEVADDDIRYLGTLIEPKLRDMRAAEGLSETAMASIWIKHGVLELPWRA